MRELRDFMSFVSYSGGAPQTKTNIYPNDFCRNRSLKLYLMITINNISSKVHSRESVKLKWHKLASTLCHGDQKNS